MGPEMAVYGNEDGPLGARGGDVIITSGGNGHLVQGAEVEVGVVAGVGMDVTPPSSTSTSRKTSVSHPSVPRTLSGSTTASDPPIPPTPQTFPPNNNAIGRGMACTFCRKRKLKCSGERPQCSSCKRYNKGACEYTTPTHNPRIPVDVGEIIPEAPIFSSEPLLHTYVNQQAPPPPFDTSRLPSLYEPIPSPFETSRRPSAYESGINTPSADLVPGAGVGAGAGPSNLSLSGYPPYSSGAETSGQYQDETAWYQAALDMPPPPPRQSQVVEYGYSPYDQAPDPTTTTSATTGTVYSSVIPDPTMTPGPSSYLVPNPQTANELVYQRQGQQLVAFPGAFDPQYAMAPGVYSTPNHDGYQPGVVHEGIYLPPTAAEPPPSLSQPQPQSMYEPHLYQNQALQDQPQPPPPPPPHTLPSEDMTHHLYDHQQQQQIQTQHPLPLPPSGALQSPLDIPSYAVPPDSIRPTNLRSISLPVRQVNTATPETTRSELSGTPATTVSLSIPEEETHTGKMHVYFNSDTPPDSVDKLTDRLGEFLLGPNSLPVPTAAPHPAGRRSSIDPQTGRKRKGREDASSSARAPSGAVSAVGFESDGLTDSARNQLLEVFFSHHKIFLDLSVPRFKYRLAHNDRRRPGLALLNAMYMWATRMGHAPNMARMEKHFYEASIRHLDASAATGDRLMDCIRAAFLLSAFQYMNGRHHSGYLLCGHAANLVKSCGLHRIQSTVFSPAPPTNPFLRHRAYLLPPPEDALELGERIHTFWAVFSLDRSSAALTGFSSSFRDDDITTPWPRELADIASGSVTQRDDVTVRDLYRLSYQHPNERSYLRWVKAVIILERASKLVFLEPEESSEHTRAWQLYRSPSSHPDKQPPGYLEQPRYRVPKAYAQTKLALEMLIQSCGDEGVFPPHRKTGGEVVISPAVILFHHICAATESLLHDTNSLDCDNAEALVAARKSVALITELPPLPIHAVDAFAPLVWVMIAKILIKEVHRLRVLDDPSHVAVQAEAQCLIDEIDRVGVMMPTSKMYARGVEQLLHRDRPNINTTTNTPF